MTSLLMSAIWHHRSTRVYLFRRSLRYRIKGQDGWCHASLEDKQSITIDRPNFSQTVPAEEKLRIIVNMKPSSLIRNPPPIPTQTSENNLAQQTVVLTDGIELIETGGGQIIPTPQ